MTSELTTSSLTFVAPPPGALLTGGNLYNAQLAEALAPLIPVRIIDQRTWLAESARPDRSSERTVTIVDSLYLAAIPEHRALYPEKHSDAGPVLLLAHMLPSHDRGAAIDAQLDLEERVLRIVDGVVATSTYVRDTTRERGLPADRIITVTPALAMPAASSPPTATDGPQRVLLVGNAIPHKGFLEFLDELADRIEPADSLVVDIVGHLDMDADYANRCTQFVRTSAALAARVTFHGPVAPADMPDLYRRAAVFVSSSRAETFGMALQEARWMGLPLLVLRGSGHADAHVPSPQVGSVHDSHGDLVDRLLSLVRAPDQLHALRMSAFRARLAGDYTWARAARSFLEQLRAMPVHRRGVSPARPRPE